MIMLPMMNPMHDLLIHNPFCLRALERFLVESWCGVRRTFCIGSKRTRVPFAPVTQHTIDSLSPMHAIAHMGWPNYVFGILLITWLTCLRYVKDTHTHTHTHTHTQVTGINIKNSYTGIGVYACQNILSSG